MIDDNISLMQKINVFDELDKEINQIKEELKNCNDSFNNLLLKSKLQRKTKKYEEYKHHIQSLMI